MSDTAEFILNRLTEWGIDRVYGYPGDGINGLMGAFHEVGEKLQFIQTRHNVAPAWEEALAIQGPVLYEAVTDPEVPPLPPHIKFEQAKKLAMALPGDPHRGRIIRESLKGKVEEFVTR